MLWSLTLQKVQLYSEDFFRIPSFLSLELGFLVCLSVPETCFQRVKSPKGSSVPVRSRSIRFPPLWGRKLISEN